MYISDLKPSSSWSSLHYTTTLDFCIHIFKLKGSLERIQMVGQPSTTPLHWFFECIYSIWRPLATAQAYTTPLHGFFECIYSIWRTLATAQAYTTPLHGFFECIYSNRKGLLKEFRWLANLPLHH